MGERAQAPFTVHGPSTAKDDGAEGGDGGGGGGEGGDGGDGGGAGGDGGANLQMHFLDEEHGPVLPPPQTSRERDEYNWQPGGWAGFPPHVRSVAVLMDRSSAVAAASHSLTVEMRLGRTRWRWRSTAGCRTS